LIKNQEIAISKLKGNLPIQTNVRESFEGLMISKSSNEIHSKKFFSLNFEKLKSLNKIEVKPFESNFKLNGHEWIVDLKFKFIGEKIETFLPYSDLSLQSKMFLKTKNDITNVIIKTNSPIFSTDEAFINYSCVGENHTSFIGAIHPSIEDRLFSMNSKWDHESCGLYDLKLILKSKDFDISLVEYLKILFLDLNLVQIKSEKDFTFEIQKGELYLNSNFYKIQSYVVCELKSNTQQNLLLFLKLFLRKLKNSTIQVDILPYPFSNEIVERINQCFQSLKDEVQFVHKWSQNKNEVSSHHFTNLQSKTDESIESMLYYSPISNVNYPFWN
jgi:hypothetical protein